MCRRLGGGKTARGRKVSLPPPHAFHQGGPVLQASGSRVRACQRAYECGRLRAHGRSDRDHAGVRGRRVLLAQWWGLLAMLAASKGVVFDSGTANRRARRWWSPGGGRQLANNANSRRVSLLAGDRPLPLSTTAAGPIPASLAMLHSGVCRPSACANAAPTL